MSEEQAADSRLLSLHVERFKSLRDVRLDGLQAVNVLIGPNNAGKSAFLQALALMLSARAPGGAGREEVIELSAPALAIDALRECGGAKMRVALPLPSAVEKSLRRAVTEGMGGGPGADGAFVAQEVREPKAGQLTHWVKIGEGERPVVRVLTATHWGELETWHTDKGRVVGIDHGPAAPPRVVQFRVSRQPGDPDTEANLFRALNGWARTGWRTQVGRCCYLPAVRGLGETESRAGVKAPQPDGPGLVNAIWELRAGRETRGEERFKEIERFVRLLSPEDLNLENRTPRERGEEGGDLAQLLFSHGEREDPGRERYATAQCGQGLQQAIVLAYWILEARGGVVCVEEPESHMHPGMQRRFLALLREEAEKHKTQFFLETHSTVFADMARPEEVFLFRKEPGKGTVITKALAEGTFKDVLVSLGHRPSDLLFHDALVFVEGRDDVAAFEEWLQHALGRDFARLKVLGMGGWPAGGPYAEVAESDVGALRGFLIVLDGDVEQQSNLPHWLDKYKERRRYLPKPKLEDYLLDATAIARTAPVYGLQVDEKEIQQRVDEERQAAGTQTPDSKALFHGLTRWLRDEKGGRIPSCEHFKRLVAAAVCKDPSWPPPELAPLFEEIRQMLDLGSNGP